MIEQLQATVLGVLLGVDGSSHPAAWGLMLVAAATAMLCLGIVAIRQWGARLATASDNA